jgi:hypothetical protein
LKRISLLAIPRGGNFIRASLSRTSIAVAALAVALSMTIGVDLMIYSFRNEPMAEDRCKEILHFTSHNEVGPSARIFDHH